MRFTKMHGAGNDFVVLDLRHGQAAPSAGLCRHLGDRRLGVGCDQILTIETARDPQAVARYGIWNNDGSRAGQCGNGARCVAAWLVRNGAVGDARNFVIESPVGLHTVERVGEDRYRVGMGAPRFAPEAIPLQGFMQADIYETRVAGWPLRFAALSMGNPHAVIEVDGVGHADIATPAQALQASSHFPESVNVGFVQVLSPSHARLRVYERGAGETRACGSGACAAAVAMMRNGKLSSPATMQLPGGELDIAWGGEVASPVYMTGPAAFVFEGVLDPSLELEA